MTSTDTVPCKLIRHGKGEHTWGECACNQWCWLGTYEMPKGKLAKLRTAYAEHLVYVKDYQAGVEARTQGLPYEHEPIGFSLGWLTTDSEMKDASASS